MSQLTTGLYRLLSNPWVYQTFQTLVGTPKLYRSMAHKIVLPEILQQNQRGQTYHLIDVGCGPGEVLSFLPVEGFQYTGYDLSPQYIEQARQRFGYRAQFYCQIFDEKSVLEIGAQVDGVLAIGLLHHLEDEVVLQLLKQIQSTLKPHGKLFTVDCCYTETQSPLARWIIQHDRGQHVRTPEKYVALVNRVFSKTTYEVQHHWMRIPYTHTVMVCENF